MGRVAAAVLAAAVCAVDLGKSRLAAVVCHRAVSTNAAVRVRQEPAAVVC